MSVLKNIILAFKTNELISTGDTSRPGKTSAGRTLYNNMIELCIKRELYE
jgi:hypothetical protein